MLTNWKNIIISEYASVEDAINIINDNIKYRTAVVVDDKNKLLGTVTDGDVRRGLIRHVPISAAVTEVMNKFPHTVAINYEKDELDDLLINSDFYILPVVENDVLVGIEALEDFCDEHTASSTVIIMAGGFGTRLKPLTDNCPKPMLKFGDKPLLEYIINEFKSYGFKKIILSVHYMQDQIVEYFSNGKEFGVEISYYREREPMGTAGCLQSIVCQYNLTGPVIVTNGDVFTKIDYQSLLNHHDKIDASATMCIRSYQVEVPYGVVKFDMQKFCDIEEKPKQNYFVNAGVYVVNADLINALSLDPPFDMTDLFKFALRRGENLSVFPLHEYWLDIGHMKDYELFQEEYSCQV